MSEVRWIETYEELAEILQIGDVVYEELVGTRANSETSDEGALIGANLQQEGDVFAVRLAATVHVEGARLHVVVVTGFRTEEPVKLSDEAAAGLTYQVGALVGWPYIREGLQSLAMRMRVPTPTLGLLRPDANWSSSPEEAARDQ